MNNEEQLEQLKYLEGQKKSWRDFGYNQYMDKSKKMTFLSPYELTLTTDIGAVLNNNVRTKVSVHE